MLDLIFFASHDQLCPRACASGHDYLMGDPESYKEYLSSAVGTSKQRFLVNWPGATWGSCVRDTIHTFISISCDGRVFSSACLLRLLDDLLVGTF